MPCCKKLLKALLHCILLAWLFAASAQAEEISVKMVEFRLGEEGYQLAANYDISLSFAVKQALSRGTPIYFVSAFSLTRARWGWLETAQQALLRTLPRYFVGDSPRARLSWLDEEVYKGEQTIKLSYSILTGRYRISRGALFQNFASLEDALNMLSRQSSAAIPAELVKKDGDYMAAARLRLDIAQLPKPLQVNALTDSDWSLDSDWYRWVIGPTEASLHNGPKTE